MQEVTPVSTADQIRDKYKESAETVRHSAATASKAICEETSHLCESTCEGIRKNPIASVVGAAVFGAAVRYLILEGRREPSFGERYISHPLGNAADTVGSSFNSLLNNLKFW